MKTHLKELGKKKDTLEKMGKIHNESEYTSVCFEYACIDSKQNALKIYMNTFYDEARNSDSPFFSLQLAGAVISAGQRNIKLVADFVQERGFELKYGDTDSLYLVIPKKHF